MDEIKVNCKAADTLDIQDMTLFQGELKSRTDADYEHIKKSILEYGFCAPFFIWEHDGVNSVLDGTGRYETLQRMKNAGYDVPLLPVAYIDCKDEATAKKVLLQINSHNGTMTVDSVRDFLGDVEFNFGDITLPDSGALDFSDEETEEDTQGDDDSPDVNEEEKSDSELGEMYDLGGNILMCGDSTDAEQVTRLMGGEKASMVFTDPPYNVAIGDKNKMLNSFQKSGRCTTNIEGDAGMTDEEVGQKLWLPAFINLRENASPDCALYVTMPQGGTHMMTMMMIHEAGWQVKHELIWVKNSPTFSMGRLDYDYQHEPILYGWNESHKWYGKGQFNKSIWQIAKPKKCDLHPTMKPVELVENAILNSSQSNDIIADLFGGSGTTLIACGKTGRRCRIMELDPHYCDVIRRRWTKWARANGKEAGTGALD